MQIHQYIYTRLSKNESPWDKSGFQSAFLPHGLLDRSDAVELESYIHRPEGEAFASKHVVFWKNILGQVFQVIYFLDDLPGESDEYGRGGVFMCHGFFIPQSAWSHFRRPMALASELEAYRYHSIDALLDSPYVDAEAGTIRPIELDEDDLEVPAAKASPLSETEAKLLNALSRLSQGPAEGYQQLVLKGAPWQIDKVLDRVFCYLPEPKRVAMGWDSGFDGGKMHFSTLRVFGYDATEPVTGSPVMLNLDGGEFELGEFGLGALEAPDAYTRWLGNCLQVPVDWPYLDSMALLAGRLELDEPLPSGLPYDACFAEANAELVRSAFKASLATTWHGDWLHYLESSNPAEVCLKTMVNGYADKDLAAMLENAIRREKIRPSSLDKAPMESVVAAGSPLLQQLATMWTAEGINVEAVKALSSSDRLDWLLIASGSALSASDAFVELVLAEGDALQNLLKEPAIRARMEAHFKAKLFPQLQPLARAMMEQLLEKEPASTYQGDTPDWLRVLENYLKTLGIPIKEIQDAASLRHQITADKLRDYPFLESCLHPAGNIAARLKDYKLRAACLRVLIHGLNLPERALRDHGFEREEIEDINPNAGGLLGKVRKLFGN